MEASKTVAVVQGEGESSLAGGIHVEQKKVSFSPLTTYIICGILN